MPEKALLIPSIIPIYPLRGKVVFPNMVVQIYLPPGEMAMLDEALQSSRFLGLAICLTFAEPCRFEDLAKVGTVCTIEQVVRLPEGGARIMVEGRKRIQILSPVQREPFFLAMVEVVEEPEPEGLIPEALMQSVGALLKIALAYGRPLPEDVVKMVDKVGNAGRLADIIAVYLDMDWQEQQKLLEKLNPLERLKDVYLQLISEVQSLQVKEDIQSGIGKRLGQHQKEFLLREQLKQIQEELGEEDPRQAEINDLKNRIARADMPENVRIVAEKELARLQRTNPASPEYTVSRAYIDCLCGVPWSRGTKDTLDIEGAQQILDEDHYDLKEVKERILELLAVRSLKASTKGPILCFVGPPGVGKTSLGRSIARAMGRKFIRMSLGGMKDEAELRGHRRTYIGAMPGRIIKEICRAESNNPVFMLDEVDKIGQDFRGDPASALLEVLDPEQNFSFTDNYLDVPFDLSKVMFITTANLLDPVPHALKDRMEVINLSGYSDEEKKQIAFKYLIPKQVQENGLEIYSPDFEETAVDKIIADYTREAGVRNLERKIASICRKIGKEITQHKAPRTLVTSRDVEELLGPRKFFSDVASGEDRIGVVTGLAWTESGGDIIFVEASRMVGKKELILTGSLGDVMQESAKTALSFVRAHAADFCIDADFFENSDIHIHVPAGAIPKDGPSAGITIAIALISLLTGSPARRDVAMSGELTLSGRILPVGGIKEKVLAARRAGVTTILLPEQNRVNLQDIDEDIRDEMNILFVDNIGDLVEKTLLSERGKTLKGFFSSKPSNTFSASS